MRTGPEEVLQMSIVDLVRRLCPGVMIFASMNGMWLGHGGKSSAYMVKMKKLGLRGGEPDLRLHWSSNSERVHIKPLTTITLDAPRTLYLECKIKPNKPTESQASCMADLTNLGFPCEVVYSLEEALQAFEAHGVPMLRARRMA